MWSYNGVFWYIVSISTQVALDLVSDLYSPRREALRQEHSAH
jgi:hypothetical protein